MQLRGQKDNWFGVTHPSEAIALVTERIERKLDWAAQLHEIGTIISHSNHHKHGAYILQNADAPGFSYPELHRLAQLVLGQRGKLRKVEVGLFQDPIFQAQLLSLRLALILCHARCLPVFNALELNKKRSGYVLNIPRNWANQFPQSLHLLEQESLYWAKESVKLEISIRAKT
jgi:exopolyphosphatase/guanosine-5'-triphosphate,3'-diphosphate pyrophosphatase